MKRFFVLAGFVAALSLTALADSWSGTVVDVMCKGKDLASHTRQCSLNCAKGGYGLVTADGKFLKFNESGNAKTLYLLKSSSKEKELKAKVTGALSGEVINVESVEIQ